MHNMKRDTEDNTFITRSKVHFNIINGVNCKTLVLHNFIYKYDFKKFDRIFLK